MNGYHIKLDWPPIYTHFGRDNAWASYTLDFFALRMSAAEVTMNGYHLKLD